MTDEEQIDYLKENIKTFGDFKKFVNHDKLMKVLTDPKYLKYHLESIGFDIVHTFCPDIIDGFIFYKYAIGDNDDEDPDFLNMDNLHGGTMELKNDKFVPFRLFNSEIIPRLIDKCSSIKCSIIMQDHAYGEFSDLWLLESEEDKNFFIMLYESGPIETSPRLLHISDSPISQELIYNFMIRYMISNQSSYDIPFANRISSAFQDIGEEDIIANENWEDTETSGHSAMSDYDEDGFDESKINDDKTYKTVNYIFYTTQDLDFIKNHDFCSLKYNLDEKSMKIVMEILIKHALHPKAVETTVEAIPATKLFEVGFDESKISDKDKSYSTRRYINISSQFEENNNP